MCGIFAHAGLKPGQFNKDKFDKLGILNEVRGKDSCGVSVDGKIQVGVDKTKIYRDFIANMNISVPTEIPIVIGHTRMSTVGGNTSANAHPFGFGGCDNGEKYGFIGVHNGTLLNHHDLALKHGISTKVEKNGVERSKIDSEILLEILYKTGNFKVFSQYNGAAATVFYNVEEPDVVYCFHGKSRVYDQIGNPVEERPLYYYKESKNSLYISSLECSLRTIGGDNNTIGEFEHNTVYKITNGDIDNAVKFKVSRHDRFQKGTARPAYTPTTGSYNNYQRSKKDTPRNAHVAKTYGVNIYRETPVVNINQLGGRVYLNKMRFWRNGHRISGFYTFVEGYGYCYLADRYKDAEEVFWKNVNKAFVDGDFIDVEKLDDKQANRSFIPFLHNKEREITVPTIFTFFDGIKLDLPEDYGACKEMESRGKAFDLQSLSMISKHPIIDLTFAFRDDNHQSAKFEGELYTGTICPLGSDKIYTFDKGNLVEMKLVIKETPKDIIKEVEEGEQIPLELPENTEKNIKAIKPDDFQSFIDNDLLEDDIVRCFEAAYTNFPRYKTQLSKYLPNPKAKEAISILETFIASTYNFISKEEKE